MITKEELEKLVEKYENEDFIKNDPVQFTRKYLNEYDIEIASFVTSCFAYGNRQVFIAKLKELFDLIDNKPYDFVMNLDKSKLKNFNYRFAKDYDVIELFAKLHNLYKNNSSLKKLFEQNFNGDVIFMLQGVCDYFYDGANLTGGYCHLVPNPKNGGAMKRLNMFLRWMVRKPPVDLGLWDFIPQSQLYIPLDTHVARISRELGLLTRNSNDMKAVIELTENLKKFDKNDPAKYDFALFGYGIDNPVKSSKKTVLEPVKV